MRSAGLFIRFAGCLIFCLMFVHVRAAGAPTPLGELLKQLGRSAEQFWRHYGAVNCTESVSQVKLGKNGKVLLERESAFDYLVVTQHGGDAFHVDESRILKRNSGKHREQPLLVTNGIQTLLLVFHPHYQDCFEYERLEDDFVGGRRMLRLRFEHVPGSRSTMALRLGDVNHPLALQGTAWIEPDSLGVAKITAGLATNMGDLGLQALTSDVLYEPTQFAGGEGPYWLPATATIEVETKHQRWRNTHKFNDYRRFSVNSKAKIRQ